MDDSRFERMLKFYREEPLSSSKRSRASHSQLHPSRSMHETSKRVGHSMRSPIAPEDIEEGEDGRKIPRAGRLDALLQRLREIRDTLPPSAQKRANEAALSSRISTLSSTSASSSFIPRPHAFRKHDRRSSIGSRSNASSSRFSETQAEIHELKGHIEFIAKSLNISLPNISGDEREGDLHMTHDTIEGLPSPVQTGEKKTASRLKMSVLPDSTGVAQTKSGWDDFLSHSSDDVEDLEEIDRTGAKGLLGEKSPRCGDDHGDGDGDEMESQVLHKDGECHQDSDDDDDDDDDEQESFRRELEHLGEIRPHQGGRRKLAQDGSQTSEDDVDRPLTPHTKKELRGLKNSSESIREHPSFILDSVGKHFEQPDRRDRSRASIRSRSSKSRTKAKTFSQSQSQSEAHPTKSRIIHDGVEIGRVTRQSGKREPRVSKMSKKKMKKGRLIKEENEETLLKAHQPLRLSGSGSSGRITRHYMSPTRSQARKTSPVKSYRVQRMRQTRVQLHRLAESTFAVEKELEMAERNARSAMTTAFDARTRVTELKEKMFGCLKELQQYVK